VARSAVGGYEDMLEDEKNGLLFRGEDAEDLARQLYVLQGDRELWARLAARGQVDAYRFTTRNCVELLEEIMEALLEKRG
jgi:glycosyltransferase involved in cell wall biosynthesis